MPQWLSETERSRRRAARFARDKARDDKRAARIAARRPEHLMLKVAVEVQPDDNGPRSRGATDVAGITSAITDRLHALLVARADALMGCPEEACELEALADAIEAYEALRWPSGKIAGGKVKHDRLAALQPPRMRFCKPCAPRTSCPSPDRR
jgi:hypothetical protein